MSNKVTITVGRDKVMDQGLLAHLSFRLMRQHELIATEGLTYILQQSDSCRRAMEQIAKNAGCDLPEVVSYHAEVTGEDMERPDIVGRTDDGAEAIIVEGKFDAGLTNNQPNNYLSRLPTSSNGVLIFVVPQLRIASLWREVVSRASENGQLINNVELPGGMRCIDLNRSHKLMMLSWSNVLNALLGSAQRTSSRISGDILQLVAFCQRIEGELFKPLSSEEITSDHIARRNNDFCNLADAIVDKLQENGAVSLAGARATPLRDGYARYMTLLGGGKKVGSAIRLDYQIWAKELTSPLWLETTLNGTEPLRPVFKQIAAEEGLVMVDKGRFISIPLPIKPGQDFPEIVNCAVDFVSKVVRVWSAQHDV